MTDALMARAQRLARKVPVPDAAVCEKCGSGDTLHRHHLDYTKPLDVQLLCPSCHRGAHTHERPSRHEDGTGRGGVWMLTPREIAIRLKDRKLSAVVKRTGLDRNTVWLYADGGVAEPTYEAVRILSEYLTEGAAT